MGSPEYQTHKKVFLAVLDGGNPNAWKPFGEFFFPDTLRSAIAKAGMSIMLTSFQRDNFNVELVPILVDPATLLKQSHLNQIVAIILDVEPDHVDKNGEATKNNLNGLYLKQARRSDAYPTPLFAQFGRYRIWYARKDTKSEKVANYIGQVNTMLDALLSKDAVLDWEYIDDEPSLVRLLAVCLENAYHMLSTGKI
jgi:hypothetical protein